MKPGERCDSTIYEGRDDGIDNCPSKHFQGNAK